MTQKNLRNRWTLMSRPILVLLKKTQMKTEIEPATPRLHRRWKTPYDAGITQQGQNFKMDWKGQENTEKS